MIYREFNFTVITLLNKAKRAMHDQNEEFNKALENIKKYKT